MKNKKIQNYENYLIYEDGRVFSIKRNKFLKPYDNGWGYKMVTISNKNRKKFICNHRLVALNFLKNPNSYPDVNHIDGDKLNNHVDNLEWCSRKYNINHAIKNGLRDNCGSKNGLSKLTEYDVAFIKSLINGTVPASKIARMFKVTHSPIYCIKIGKTWKNVIV